MTVRRRDFVVSSLLAAAASSLLGARRRAGQDRAWIPPDDLLADLPRLMDLASVPGVSISVVEDGAVAWTRSFGFANADTQAPVTANHVFAAASLGKPVFAFVVLKLVEEGKLDLDRPLVEFHRPADLPAEADRITATHVLSHTSGLRNWRNRADQKLMTDFPPGGRFQYSGEGYYWLSQAVEAVTGQGIDRVMRERLFGPAAMPRATYGWSRNHSAWTVAGHGNRGAVGNHFSRSLGDKLVTATEPAGKPMSDWTSAQVFRAVAQVDPSLPLLPNFVIPNVAGSLLCTAPEYAAFVTLMMSGRRRADWEIGEASRRSMLAGRIDLKPSLSWGLGWGLERRAEGTFFWHWGDNGIFKAFTVGDPARGRAIVVFTNAEGGPKVYQRIVRAATALDLNAFLWV